ncbi:serine/arginine repetitive matrix protein 3 isoform X2 [Lepisosteus oculatus]|uniref:serine/arginine repetitive matrix protein 3 isoform X2 n=1 Tax=Lepisosteus oculatus TaxID=7918 RepID=UPI00371B171C
MYDGAKVPSPQESANGFSQPGASASWPKPEEEEARKAEPVLAKKAHREILDHERKRRVELKCMELQEMMEEQGYSEEEIRQKVGTFRQMLMEKEGVITREDPHGCPIVDRGCEEPREDLQLGEDYEEEYDCHGEYYERDSIGQEDYRMKRKCSSSSSPPPKKRKKKKSGRRRSRFDSSSPPRKEKKKKSGKKHKRDRSASGSRKKRRYRSGSPKNKHKDKNKQRKRSPLDSPSQRSYHRGSCCSSRSASLSSTGSLLKSPSRTNCQHRADGHKVCCSPSSRSVSPSPGHASPSALWHNGHRDGTKNGKDSEANNPPGEKSQDKSKPTPASPSVQASASPEPKEAKAKTVSRSPSRLLATPGEARAGDERYQGRQRSRSASVCKRVSRQRVTSTAPHSPKHTGCSSDSGHSQHSQSLRDKSTQPRKAKGSPAPPRRRRHRAGARRRNPSPAPAKPEKHRRPSGGRRKSSSRSLRQRSSSWGSSRSGSRSRSRTRPGRSRTPSPHSRQNTSREKDSEGRSHHTDTESRARRRSRSYSPIRKRRRDSPSFMEPRRITRCLEDNEGQLLSCRQGSCALAKGPSLTTGPAPPRPAP